MAQGAPAVVVGALMITAPLLVGNLIGSSLGFNTYNPLQGGNSPRNSDGSPRVNKNSKKDDNNNGGTVI